MKSVWKYLFKPNDIIVLSMPEGAKPLSVQVQGSLLCLWAIVDTTKEKTPRTFRVFGTGHPIDDDALAFVGTVQMYDGKLVWHVFEEESR